jgi:cellobiose phosphorylase
MKSQSYPVRLQSPSGLCVHVNANGSIRRIEHGDVTLNLFVGNELEGGPANIYLRRHGTSIDIVPLLGPRSPGSVCMDEDGLTVHGELQHLCFEVTLVLAQSAPAWFWHVELENTGTTTELVDLVYAQDIALAPYGAVRMNEYYVSQYVDHAPLTHARCGAVVAVRQNLSVGGRYPWVVIGSLGEGVSFATDALQVHGLGTRAGEMPTGLRAAALPGKRHQHEHSMAAIQDAPVSLQPGAVARRGFFAWFEADHPAASSSADLRFVEQALALPEADRELVAATEHPSQRTPPSIPPCQGGNKRGVDRPLGDPPTASLFSARPTLVSLDLADDEITELFGKRRRHVERENGSMLSFFTASGAHVVLEAKDLRVLRPHGHIIRSGDHLVPDEASLTSTTWMAGVFHSMITQGHVNINRFLSTTRSYLGLLRSGGQRVFVELEDGYHLLDVPSAYEMTPSGCRWFYKHRTGLIEVRSWAPTDRHELNLSILVLRGNSCRFLVSNHVALNGDDGADALPVQFAADGNGVVVRPIADSDVGRRFPHGFFRIDAAAGTTIERVGGDELLFVDGQSRHQPFLSIVAARAKAVSFRITGHLMPVAEASGGSDRAGQWAADQRRAGPFWRNVSGPLALHPSGRSKPATTVRCLQDIVPWLAHNALVHYLAPRGLEQYSGGGWGTRDVCQGPVEMLLALGRWEPLRDLLMRVFRTQNADGDWPQWFMFFERERNIRPADSHGDIVFWPLLALAQYLLASEEASILDTTVPFFHPQGDDQAEQATVWAHVERALEVIAKRLIPGTSLVAYGHGDWNDSLQPVDPSMCERLCSAWTVTLHYQTMITLAQALRRVGRAGPAVQFDEHARRIREDFQRLLMPDGTITGYAYFHADGHIDYLLHPSDAATGIHYSLLPMIHAVINGLLTPEQATAHVGYIREHLLAADGARLFDRPFVYQGGPQHRFQRAESSSFFGREIGIMYTHAHLRYAEAMARFGDAGALFLALRQANPLGLRSVVPAARLRQANCYYSSSDAAFADRYEALSEYEKVRTGAVPFEGGWRVYSSGAGIAMRLIHECFLGIRKGHSVLVLDPVIPRSLDRLATEIALDGRKVRVEYRVKKTGHGVMALTLNGKALAFEPLDNPYRPGGAEVSMAAVRALLGKGVNTLTIQLR